MFRQGLFAAAAVLAVGAPAQAAAPSTPPEWAKVPEGDQLLDFLPARAAKEGVDGRATVECTIGVDGVLKNCVAVSESPEGYGFGPAAVTATSLFRMKPGTIDGRPVEGTIRVPIKWELDRGVVGKTFDLVTRAVWLEAPTRSDIQAVRPAGGSGPVRVVLNCGFKANGALSGCEEKDAPPRSGAYVAAARKLVEKFRTAAAENMKDARILLPIQFDPVDSPELQDGRALSKPVWAQRANPQALSFPEAAHAAGLREGRAVAECTVAAQGALTDCRVSSESAPGVGFGDAALLAASRYKASPWTAEGRPVDGARVRLAFRFVDEPAATEPATPAP